MENFPEEIMIDILSRLPTKTVGRCRCVAKPWKSLLSKPQFIKTHLIKTQHSEQESLILRNGDYDSDFLYLAQLSNAHNVLDEITLVATRLNFTDQIFNNMCNIRSSCSGLVLIEESGNKFYLINPTTKQIKHLPNINSPFRSDSFRFSSSGVGYDSVSDDYKVVVFYSFVDTHEHYCIENNVHVYSLRNDAWKTVESPPDYLYVSEILSGVCIDGCIHWAANRTKLLMGSCVILTFDLQNEKFREMPSPSSEGSKYPSELMHVVRLGECLGFWCYFGIGAIELWKMEEYGVKESWTKCLVIGLDREVGSPIFFMAKEHLVLTKYVYKGNIRGDTLVVRNLKDRTLKVIGEYGTPNLYIVQLTFIPSLVSPHRGNGAA